MSPDPAIWALRQRGCGVSGERGQVKRTWIQRAGIGWRRAWACVLLVLSALLLAGCAEPVPAHRMQYVGAWHAEGVYLFISADGRMEYNRRRGAERIAITAPIQRFEGDDFIVGLGPFSTTFVVSRPPWQEAGQWKMVVDGVELVRRPTGRVLSY